MNIIFAITILLVYTITLSIKGGNVPSSLSASVFNIQQNKRWIWCVVIFAVCFLCVPTYIDKVSENTKFLAFLAIAGLLFVGGAPLVKAKDDKLQYNVHCASAVICAVCSQLVLVFNMPLLLLAWIPWAVAFVCLTMGTSKWRTQVFWAEMVCFGNTFVYNLT